MFSSLLGIDLLSHDFFDFFIIIINNKSSFQSPINSYLNFSFFDLFTGSVNISAIFSSLAM